ncbi:MAG: hypothetical protein WC767_01965 [Candidatus Paceibacterota bacterium]|jgi:hypothetical protein
MDIINFLNLEYIFLAIANFFTHFDLIVIINFIAKFFYFLRPIAIGAIIIISYIIAYSLIGLRKIEKQEDAELYGLKKAPAPEAGPEQDTSLNEKWLKVQEHIKSENPSDWRLAIIEADIMLDEMLEKRGYQGDSLGEKLKSIDKSDMLTLQDAWEAHKVRNQIAHAGSDFQLNEREAKRVIDLFQKVFEEFYHI